MSTYFCITCKKFVSTCMKFYVEDNEDCLKVCVCVCACIYGEYTPVFASCAINELGLTGTHANQQNMGSRSQSVND